MDTTTCGVLAVELHPHSPTHWVATFYPLAGTSSGHWADVTTALHQALMPPAHRPLTAARWLELGSPNPGHASYDDYPAWRAALAAGYATACRTRSLETTRATGGTLTPEETRQLRTTTVVVPAGQLSEWLLEDLQDLEL